MWKLILTIIVLAVSLQAKTLNGKVVSITDGDTIKLLTQDKILYKIRLKDIDTPEKKQAFGKKAKENLAKYIAAKTVTIDYKKKDRYGRIIGTIYYQDIDINLQQVKDGFAWVYRKYSKNPTYLKYEALAKQSKKGLWIDKDPIAPWIFRKNKRK